MPLSPDELTFERMRPAVERIGKAIDKLLVESAWGMLVNTYFFDEAATEDVMMVVCQQYRDKGWHVIWRPDQRRSGHLTIDKHSIT